MMDHARHLSSPSPTSPFLFHHSERSFKSNPLTPLLSSTADVTSIDDCFSTGSSSVSHHNPFVVGGVIDHNHHHHHNHHHQHLSLVDNHHNHHATNHHNHHNSNHHHHNNSHQQQNHHSQHHQRHHHNDMIDQDSLAGVDDDDGMHNMLSGSSTSSTSTMPLLTESHSHHSFSRISLEEYSPLSLVEDCDNALPISPTSLACGSHHSFKSSLNGLSKMDNLVGDVHDDDDDDHHNGVHHDPDDDDVNDARSLSPSLLSGSNNNHHNLWSTASSTAITQNTSLLNSTSTSFLLSQHHQQQLNSLIQQLEPQSLDEPPPMLGGQINSSYDLINPSGTSINNLNRPSSEPPAGCGLDSQDIGGESKSLSSQLLQSKSKQPNNSKQSSKTSAPPSRSRRSRNRSSTSVSNASSAKQASSANNLIEASNSINQQEKNASAGSSSNLNDKSSSKQSVHCSKLHLQLNHHEKLQELQRRLFGTNVLVIGDTAATLEGDDKHPVDNVSASTSVKRPSNDDCVLAGLVKEEPDSSAGQKQEDATTSSSSASLSTTHTTSTANIIQVTGKVTNTKASSPPTMNKTRTRPARSRRSRAVAKNNSCKASSSTNQSAGLFRGIQKTVTTETAEPDTTTKSSDCIKLADLLSNYNESKSGTTGFILNGFASTSEANESDNGEKRLQQIQVQVSPSITVVTNGGIVQPFNIQQQQQQQQPRSGAVITTSANFTNQISCRPQAAVTTTAGQLKGIVSNNELLKSGETVLSNWSFQANNGNNNSSNNHNSSNNNNSSNTNQVGTNLANGQTIGAHQIAIQVICQDGTSLVLPVSSAAGLNAAVSLSSQHQQLQAVLANNANQQQQRNSNQLLPLMSVSNIIAQQQMNGNNESGNGSSNQTSQSTSTTTTNQQTTSGLAASSPTLAALLDTGSNRSNNDLSNSNFSSQNFVSTNLLRKFVSGNSNELKRGEKQQLTLQQGPTLNLTNCGSLVTVCATAPANTSNSNPSSQQQQQPPTADKSSNGFAEKRIKLETAEVSELPTTFTLIDPQGLIVANGNESKPGKQTTSTTASSDSRPSVSMVQKHHNLAASSVTAAIAMGATTTKAIAADTSLPGETTKQLSKMTSSTGNRPVDPTQPFRCEHCNSTFTRLGNFTRHKKIHTIPTKDGQRFKCDVCSKSFLQRCDLARHLHIHRGTEPHRCNICGKGYIRHSDLVTHQRFHNKEKPFGCPHCSKGFCQRGDLNRHLRSIHLQMKPILCPCCNRKFAKQETLLRHLNTAHRGKSGLTAATIATTTSPSLATTAVAAVTTTTTPNAIISELKPNYTTTQVDDKQTAISVVTNAAVLNNNNITQKSTQIVSQQALQATFCKVPQSVDPSTTSGQKTETSPSDKETISANDDTSTNNTACTTKSVAKTIAS